MQASCRKFHGAVTCAGGHERGFSITEMLVAVSIAAILTTVAVPSFNGMVANQRAKTLASVLYATLSKTRAEALTLNGNVTLQPKAGGWGSGWRMLDANNNVLDDYTTASNITIVGPAAVTYRASGRLPAGAVTMFQISTTSGSTVIHQCVSVDLGGRPYMAPTPTC
jgi:type IV fimbrial biogenesis protein FimT